MGDGKLTRIPRNVALCAAPASTGGFDPGTEHAVMGILVALFASAAIWMFRRWPMRPGPAPAAEAERAPSRGEPAADVLARAPRPASA